jgi:hypothetical protein
LSAPAQILDTLRMVLSTVAAVAETTAAEAARRHRQRLSSEGWYTTVAAPRPRAARSHPHDPPHPPRVAVLLYWQ